MKKSLFIKVLATSCLFASVATIASGVLPSFAEGGNNIQKDIIKPLSHIRGEEINTLPYDIQEWYRRSADSYTNIWNLYNAHPMMDSKYWHLISANDYKTKTFSPYKTNEIAKYNGLNLEIPVVITEKGKYDVKTPVNLIIEGSGYKTKYSPGETFDPMGLTIKVVYSNMTSSNVTSSVTFDSKQLAQGDRFVTATYGDLSVNIPIIVSAGTVSGSTLAGITYSGLYKDLYRYGESFDRTNFIAIARFADGSSKNITNNLTWPSDAFDAIKADRSAKQTAIYEKWDDFHQINNILKWEVKDGVEVKNYNVTVSLNPELTKVLYKATVTEPEYKMLNMYTGEDYYWQVQVNKKDGSSVKSPIYNFTVADTPRTVYIQGISNTRDVGGYETPWGEFKQGYVYRGARIDEATAVGVDTFKNELGIRTDLDLRTPNSEVGGYNPLLVDQYVGPVDLLSYAMLDANSNPYNPNNPTGRQEALRRLKVAFEPFTRPESYPIYYHCSVGRDRTGTVGGILDALMGRTADEIVHNYFISVFSVTGHYNIDNIVNGFNNAWSIISALNHVEGGEGKTLAEQAELMLLQAGLTREQINSIRDILTGKVPEAHNSQKFLTNEDNYEGQVVVSFKQVGDGEEQVFAPINSVVVAPFALKEGYGWYNGDELVDISNPITRSMNLVSKPIQSYKVTIHYVMGEKNDEVLSCKAGETIEISSFINNGVVPVAYLDTGKEISRLVVDRDVTINLLFK